MSYSTQRAVSDGSLALLDINIKYFDREEITVYFDSVQDAYPWNWVGTTDNQLAFSPAVPIGTEVLVKRTTNISKPRHLFNAGAAFTEATLDEVLLQNLHIAQEAKENATIEEVFTNLNMHGYKMTNVGDPANPMDAVNLRSFAPHDAQILVYRGQCEAARDAAKASAVEAANSAASVNATNLAHVNGDNAVGTWGIDISGTAAKATHALAADTATNADHASTADSATTAGTANAILDGAVSSTAKIVDSIITPNKLAQKPGEATYSMDSVASRELTGIPNWVSSIDVVFSGVTTGAVNFVQVQLGSGSYVTIAYSGVVTNYNGGTTFTTGFGISTAEGTAACSGVMTLTKLSASSTKWLASSNAVAYGSVHTGAGVVDVAAVLDRVKVLLTGAGTFSGGTITIKYR